MSEAKRTFLLMLRHGDEKAAALGREIAAWLEARGAAATLREHRTGHGPDVCPAIDGRPLDMVLVLGGDGTFIGVARQCLSLGIPLLGLNLGRVGFLAEGADSWETRLEALLDGRFTLSRRVSLAWEVTHQDRVSRSGLAVNDLVVSRGELARLIRLSVRYGDDSVGAMRADGLIVSSPTGSTAYGFSAGGPLVLPEMEALCLTPVCPFLNNFRPVVLPADRAIVIGVEELRGEVRLSVDGQHSHPLEPGDRVTVRRGPDDLLMAQTSGTTYFARLANKGFFTER
jgi:NAD+ kinase